MRSAPVPVIYDSLDPPALAARAYVLDVWGVLWDGVQAYPGAAACLLELRRRNRRVLLLSNAPRRRQAVIEGLAGIGIADHLFDDVLTSGDLCRAACAGDPGRIGNTYHYLGLAKDRALLEGLPYREAPGVGSADFILNLGTRRLGDRKEAYRSELLRARDRNLPMLCANPDQTIVRRDGTRIDCAGALAELYASLGGSVRSFGKPLRPTYDACLARLRNWLPDLDTGSVLAVGDSLMTDIKGARAAGIRTALVAGGVHGRELGLRSHGERPGTQQVAALVRGFAVRPDFVISSFRWLS